MHWRTKLRRKKAGIAARRNMALTAFIVGSSACASSTTGLDRSALDVSVNSRVVARNIIPRSDHYPNVVEHLALAQEVYQKQLGALKARRGSVRARSRALDATSYAAFALASLGVGTTAIATRNGAAGNNLQAAGYAALGGLAVGTLLKVFGYMQEDPSSVDTKIRQLQGSYDSMMARLKMLGDRQTVPDAQEVGIAADMAATIEAFIAQAMAIEVKG